MPRRIRLRERLLMSHLVVIAIGSATVFVSVGLVVPGAFDAAMGHATGDGMDELMQGVTPAGSSVLLVATADQDEVVIGVIDQGPGLTGEQLERIFERF